MKLAGNMFTSWFYWDNNTPFFLNGASQSLPFRIFIHSDMAIH